MLDMRERVAGTVVSILGLVASCATQSAPRATEPESEPAAARVAPAPDQVGAGQGEVPPDGTFDVPGELRSVASAENVDGVLRLTTSTQNAAGAYWADEKMPVADGFRARFRFRISDPVANEYQDGADGLAFVIQDAPDGVDAVTRGGGIGYHGIPNSLAVELDTYRNDGEHGADDFGDPDGNHVSVQSRGTEPNTIDHAASLGQAAGLAELMDGKPHEVVVDYDAAAGRLAVYVDDMNTPQIEADVNLADLLKLDGGKAFVGFTAATGTACATHDILSWSIASYLGEGRAL